MEQSSLRGEDTKGFLDPNRIIKYFDLKKGDFVADFGAGHGFFTIPMARMVGGEGKVYAVDIQKGALDIIREKARHENLLNIELVWADLDQPNGSKLKDKFIDFILIANILFQAEEKQELFHEAYRLLRESGRCAIVEWDEFGTSFGPAIASRIKKSSAEDLARAAGFQLEREFETGSNHYGLLFKK